MTKLGTPIGAGPKGAIVVVGLASVGAPLLEYWEPPLLDAVCICTPAVALGAVAPPPEFSPPPLTSPRFSLWCTLALPPEPIVAPALKPPPCLGASTGAGAAAGGASTLLLLVGLAGGV